MSASTTFASWATNREAKKAERWHKNVQRIEKKPPAPGKHKTYIRWYFFGIALGLVAAVAFLFKFGAILLWPVASIIIIISWIRLRYAIRLKDDAPLEVLDEYESAVVNQWRKIAFGLHLTISTGFALILVTFSSFFMHEEVSTQFLGHTTLTWVYWLSLVYLILMLSITVLPALGYAITFDHSDDEDLEPALAQPLNH